MISLSVLRYFLTKELAIEVLPILQKLRKHDVNMIRRKALLILMSIHAKHPDVLPDIKQIIIDALADPDTPVVFAGISMLSNSVKADPFKFKDMSKKLSDILFRVVDHKYPKEYDYHKIPAPWVQI